MKRRKFLKLSTGSLLAGTALATLPNFVWAQEETKKTTPYTNDWNMTLQTTHCLVEIENALLASEKSYLLYVGKNIPITLTNKNDLGSTVTKTLKIRDIKKHLTEDDVVKYELFVDLTDGKPSETDSHFVDYDRIDKLELIDQVGLTLYNREGKFITVLQVFDKNKNYNEVDEFEDCFVTTACVKHMNLKDDCAELQTLRSLRENFMRGTEYGNERIDAYEIFGPQIVNKLNQLQNAKEVYEHIYKNAVLPTYNLALEGKQKEAVNHYIDFMVGIWLKIENE